jgi:tRNA(fMet)-specific endonuclease VapC
LALLIDSSVLIAVERAGESPAALLASLRSEPVAISAITATELLHGVHRADSAVRRGRREQFVEDILGTLPVLPFDLPVARVHSRIWADLRKRGKVVSAHNLIIAATALTHDLHLLTRDPRDFGRVENLRFSVW